ncbi:MAG: Bug family tripartite tricarboxylate transporter substrate binding protein [Woeseiaceae bacterium]
MLAAGALISGTGFAQSWPQKTVKFIVPFPAGGAVDIPARMVAEKLSEKWGQPVIVDNRPGAGGNVGAAEAARAEGDGYTLFWPSGTVMTAAQYIYPKLNYNPEKDFVPVTNVVSGPFVLVVNAKAPYRTIADFIEAAKANPGKFTFGHAGIGSQSHLAAESFVHAAGLQAVSVPYKGDPPALAGLVAGDITFTLSNLAPSLGHITGGRLRALGITSGSEAQQLPGVPPLSRTLPGFETYGWFGIVAPAGTPSAVIARVHNDVKAILSDTKVKARLFTMGMTPVANTPEEMGKAMVQERSLWARVVKERNLQQK